MQQKPSDTVADLYIRVEEEEKHGDKNKEDFNGSRKMRVDMEMDTGRYEIFFKFKMSLLAAEITNEKLKEILTNWILLQKTRVLLISSS